MNQEELQDLPGFLQAMSALVATASVNAGVQGKEWDEVARCWKSKQSQVRAIFEEDAASWHSRFKVFR